MTVAWTNTRADYDAQKAVRTGRATALVDRSLALCRMPFQLYIADCSTNNTGFTIVAFPMVYLPDWCGGLTLHVNLEVKKDAAATSGDWRLTIIDLGLTGPTTNFTNNAFAESEATLVMPAGASGEHLLSIEARHTGGGVVLVNLRSIDRATAWWTD